MEITALLSRVHQGDREALNALIPLIYDELKKVAAARLRNEPKEALLNTTGLVHETFLRLAEADHPMYESRSHFYGIASRVMRQVLVDFARARASQKRSGEELRITEIPDFGRLPDESLLLMDQVFEKLGQTDPLKVRLLEMRYFGGMTAEESAEALSMSVHVVRRELRLSQAWLRKEMAG